MSNELLVMPGYVRTMAAYNSEMNRRIYEAAARLSDAERKREQGAFWGSIHGTLSHLLWGDRMWMSRFDGWPPPEVPSKDSATMIADFATLKAEREAADAKIEAWAARVDEAWLAADEVWFSGAAGRELSMKRHFPRDERDRRSGTPSRAFSGRLAHVHLARASSPPSVWEQCRIAGALSRGLRGMRRRRRPVGQREESLNARAA